MALYTAQYITSKKENKRPSVWFNINTLLQKYSLFFFTLCSTLHMVLQMLYHTLETSIILLGNVMIIYKITYLAEHILEVHKQLSCYYQNLISEVGLGSLTAQGLWCLSYLEGCIHAFRQERSANHFSVTKGSWTIYKTQIQQWKVQVSETLSGKCI